MDGIGRWREQMGRTKTVLGEKTREALASVLPITAIVLALCFTISPVPTDVLLAFLAGAVLLILGMGFFTLGADMAMGPIGQQLGSKMAGSRKLWVVVSVSFLIGVVVTMSEPDLQVLANQVPGIPNMLLVGTVALGVGVFLVALGSWGLCRSLRLSGPAVRVVTYISKASFCVFLTHVFFLQFFARHGLRAAEGPPLFTVPLVSLLVLICGWGAYALFSRVPGVRRWLI